MLTAKQASEAERLCRYLVGRPCPPQAAMDYHVALGKLGCDLGPQQQWAWQRMMQSALVLRCLDAGLAIADPTSALRKRIFIMLCILETEPSLAEAFLPKERDAAHVFVIGFRGARAVASAVLGVLLVKIWRLA